MGRRQVGVRGGVPEKMARGLDAIRSEMDIAADFPREVLAAAERGVREPRLPERDLTELPFETIDPAGSRDLDQAMYLERDGSGYRLYYAIADVAAFVDPDGPIDLEAHRRGVTYYAPDRRTPLHPAVLSEGAASLLPGETRPALVWDLRIGADGQSTEFEVRRAMVRSVAQHTYAEVQHAIDGGTASDSLALLAEVGPLRQRNERERGGVSLPVPEQEIDTNASDGAPTPDGSHWDLTFRAQLPVEGWNEQVSLLTGMAAAHIMMYGQVGILRTLPPADHASLRGLHRTARALKINWPSEQGYPEFVRSLDPARPRHVAMLMACTRLFRGASYTTFSGGVPDQRHAEHAALAIEYAHCTAPLRRLVDRYALETCAALCADEPVPEWVMRDLEALPQEMDRAARGAAAYERAIIDLMEACRLESRVGQQVTGVVVEVKDDLTSGTLMVDESAVEAKIHGTELPLGHEVTATVAEADPAKRLVRFELA